MKRQLRLIATAFCLLAARAEARDFSFGFPSQRMAGGSAPVSSFAVGDRINLSLADGQPSLSITIVAELPGFGGTRV